MQIRIGPDHHIADEHGTHEPGELINFPSSALVSLAQRAHDGDKTALDPETGVPYATIEGLALPGAPEPAPAAPTPEPSADLLLKWGQSADPEPAHDEEAA